jgi:hypothetical protein
VAGGGRAAGRGFARRLLRCAGDRGKAARARYNAEHAPPLTSTTYTGDLLPGREVDLRWRAEDAARTERRLGVIVHRLVRASLLDGREHAAMLDGADLGIQVLADQGHETYVAIRIIGSVPRLLVATILSLIPGCQADAWMSDYAMPERAVAPKSKSGPTSWTPPPPRNSSATSHETVSRAMIEDLPCGRS